MLNLNVERLKHNNEILSNELKICHRRLESKCEALSIISKNLDECRKERDQYKLFIEQMQTRYNFRKHTLPNLKNDNVLSRLKNNTNKNNSKNYYNIEIEELKQKLKEALDDAKLLREQLGRHRIGSHDEALDPRYFPAHERQDLVNSLENNQIKMGQLERDLQQVLDEKEELVSELVVFKDKYNRLNQHLNHLMGSTGSKLLDIDAVLVENKYLKEKIKQVEDEKLVVMSTIGKYKLIVEKTRTKSFSKFGQPRVNGIIITQKQVQQMLYSDNMLQNTPQTLNDLRSLCEALLESVNDKKIALIHQKKTNKILGERVTELELRFKKLGLSSNLLPINLELCISSSPIAISDSNINMPIFNMMDSIDSCELQDILTPKMSTSNTPTHSKFNCDEVPISKNGNQSAGNSSTQLAGKDITNTNINFCDNSQIIDSFIINEKNKNDLTLTNNIIDSTIILHNDANLKTQSFFDDLNTTSRNSFTTILQYTGTGINTTVPLFIDTTTTDSAIYNENMPDTTTSNEICKNMNTLPNLYVFSEHSSISNSSGAINDLQLSAINDFNNINLSIDYIDNKDNSIEFFSEFNITDDLYNNKEKL